MFGGLRTLGRGTFQNAVVQADMARDKGKYDEAAALYEKALTFKHTDAAIHIQAGHMFKEAKNLEKAEKHYLSARRLTPDDPDLSLQLGHFYRMAGRLDEAEIAYRSAIALHPNWSEPALHLTELFRRGWRGNFRKTAETDAHGLGQDLEVAYPLIPELVPRTEQQLLFGHSESIDVRSLGRIERTKWGLCRVLRGVEAVRGYCSSIVPIVEMRLSLNDQIFFKGALEGFPFKSEKYDDRLRKWVFNKWFDFSQFRQGQYQFTLTFVAADGTINAHQEMVLIASEKQGLAYLRSDAYVPPKLNDENSEEEFTRAINAAPSMVRSVDRPLFPDGISNVLVMRTDQLGDLVCSIPAIRRLREILPKARLIGLLTSANADLARSLDVFDEVLTADIPDVWIERRRVISTEEQARLKQVLAPYNFDVGIDLSVSNNSRLLLLLSEAKFLVGFKDPEYPWLDMEFDVNTHDPRNGLEPIPHSAKVLALIETFGAALRDRTEVIRRLALSRFELAPFGLAEGGPFAILHTGARLVYSRWPYFNRLAEMLLASTDLRIVMMADDVSMREALPSQLTSSDRFQLIDRKLPFDQFDALLSFCSVFVGNDSGPKHLASLRGANVVSLHMARNNWNEWGQENTGYVISRRVPCAGCVIQHDPEECGKGYACIVNIKPEEVFGAVMEVI